MLPILRILPVGGVLLAILILVLALSPPDGSRSPMATIAPARGALVDRDRHPEARQFLILAALKRADELNRLRELPDRPTRSNNMQDAAKVAGLPGIQSDAEPDETGSINETPAVSVPIDIGELSSTELPVTLQEESRPAVNTPEPAKTHRETRRRTVHRLRRTRVVSAPPPQLNFFEILFGGQRYQPPATSANQAAHPYGTYQANQAFRTNQAGQPYGTNQSTQTFGAKQASQSAVSYTNPVPQTNSY